MSDIVHKLQQAYCLAGTEPEHPIRQAVAEIRRLRVVVEKLTAERDAAVDLSETYARANERQAQRVMALAAQAGQGEAVAGAWDGAEEWMPLAWALCAEEHGEEACTQLLWTGGTVPEPWGDRWLKYEDEAKRLIALVRKHVPSPAPPPAPAAPSEPSEPSEAMVTRAHVDPAVRDALLFALWHHQGGSSPVGQPIRTMLGIGPHERLTDEQLQRAKAVRVAFDLAMGESAYIADAARVIAWARDPQRKPAVQAFTSGAERQAAYWIEWAWSEPAEIRREALREAVRICVGVRAEHTKVAAITLNYTNSRELYAIAEGADACAEAITAEINASLPAQPSEGY